MIIGPTLASVIFYWKSESEMLLVVRSPSLEVILARRVDRNLIIPFALNLHWHMLIKLRPTCRDLWLGLLGENLSSCATADYGARAATTHSIRDYMCRAPTKLITKPQSTNPNSLQFLPTPEMLQMLWGIAYPGCFLVSEIYVLVLDNSIRYTYLTPPPTPPPTTLSCSSLGSSGA